MRDATYTHGHHESVLRSHRNRTVENSAAYLIPRHTQGFGDQPCLYKLLREAILKK